MPEFYLKVAGVTFEGRQQIIAGLKIGQPLKFVPDPINPYDRSAVKIVTLDNTVIGFVGRDYNAQIFKNLMTHSVEYQVSVSSITGGFGANYGCNIKVTYTRKSIEFSSTKNIVDTNEISHNRLVSTCDFIVDSPSQDTISSNQVALCIKSIQSRINELNKDISAIKHSSQNVPATQEYANKEKKISEIEQELNSLSIFNFAKKKELRQKLELLNQDKHQLLIEEAQQKKALLATINDHLKDKEETQNELKQAIGVLRKQDKSYDGSFLDNAASQIIPYLEDKGLKCSQTDCNLIITARSTNLSHIPIVIGGKGNFLGGYNYKAIFSTTVNIDINKIDNVLSEITEKYGITKQSGFSVGCNGFRNCFISTVENSYVLTLIENMVSIDNKAPGVYCYTLLKDFIERIDESSAIWNT